MPQIDLTPLCVCRRHQGEMGSPVNHSFIHCRQHGKADGISPSAYHLEVDVLTTLNLLALMVVIVIIKVKIIIKKR